MFQQKIAKTNSELKLMRIAIFSETYLPDANGVATHIGTLAGGLKALGHEVLIVCADHSVRRMAIKNGVMRCPSIRTGRRFYGYSLSSPISARRMRMIREWSPDIIHIHNEFGIGLSGVRIAKRLRVPLVYTIHTMYGDYLGYISGEIFMKMTKKLSKRYLCYITAKADAVTGASQKVADYLKSCGAECKIELIPNTTELKLFENVAEEEALTLKRNLGIPKNALTLCFCGRLGTEKSVDVLLKIWAHCKRVMDDIFLVIIGDGPEYKNLRSLTDKADISDSVMFLGRIAHDRLPPYYAMCDAYITASVTENHSVSMLEALASGLPIIHAEDEQNKNQLREGITGFSFSGADEVILTLDKLKCMNRDEREKLSLEARKSVEGYGKEEQAKKLCEIYEKVKKEYEKNNQLS